MPESSPTGCELSDGQPHVRYIKSGHVATVVMNRPHVLNAMDLRMHEELAAAWDDFEADDVIRVGILTGSGDRAFSVGQDLTELAATISASSEETATFGSRGRPGWPRLTERFGLTKPLIAKVRGYALGGGFELALACDIIVASDDAVFALPEARLGLIAGAGGVFRLTRQLPFKTAMGYLMTGRCMPARRALELGLVNDAVPADELDACVGGWVRDILDCAPLAVRAIKEVATRGATLPLSTAFASQYEWETRRRRSSDAREGPLAFAQKRRPQWSGQ